MGCPEALGRQASLCLDPGPSITAMRLWWGLCYSRCPGKRGLSYVVVKRQVRFFLHVVFVWTPSRLVDIPYFLDLSVPWFSPHPLIDYAHFTFLECYNTPSRINCAPLQEPNDPLPSQINLTKKIFLLVLYKNTKRSVCIQFKMAESRSPAVSRTLSRGVSLFYSWKEEKKT